MRSPSYTRWFLIRCNEFYSRNLHSSQKGEKSAAYSNSSASRKRAILHLYSEFSVENKNHVVNHMVLTPASKQREEGFRGITE